MSVEELKKNSRTIRQSRLGLYDEFGKFAAAAAVLVAAAVNAHIYITVSIAGVIVIWCLISIPRWRRVRKYRIEDHFSGERTKDADSGFPSQQ